MNRSLPGALLAMLVLALARPVPAAAAPGAAAVVPALDPEAIGLRPCRLPGLAAEARCGVLPRPLDPQRPQARQVEVAVAVVPALARLPRPDPVVFVAGGPGQGAIDLAGPVAGLLARVLYRRDLVLVDLRGSGRSGALACDFDAPQAVWRPLAETWDPRRREVAVQACRAALQAVPGQDLARYATPFAVDDLLAVMQALGYPQFNAVGASYGTRVVLEALRRAPQRVRRAVLDGVAPPDMRLPASAPEDAMAALEAVSRACATEPACAAAHPRWLERLRAFHAGGPWPVAVRHPWTGGVERLTVDRTMLDGLLRVPLYDPGRAAALPAAVDALLAGRWEPLVGLAAAAGGGARRTAQVATGLHLSVICSEDLPDAAAGIAPAPPAPGGFFDDPYPGWCAGWPRAALPAGFRQIGPAGAPVWLLSGGRDPVTPPRHGERVAAALGPLAVHSVVPEAGHGLLALPCIGEALPAFLDTAEPGAAIDVARRAGAACAAALPAPRAWQPVEGPGR